MDVGVLSLWSVTSSSVRYSPGLSFSVSLAIGKDRKIHATTVRIEVVFVKFQWGQVCSLAIYLESAELNDRTMRNFKFRRHAWKVSLSYNSYYTGRGHQQQGLPSVEAILTEPKHPWKAAANRRCYVEFPCHSLTGSWGYCRIALWPTPGQQQAHRFPGPHCNAGSTSEFARISGPFRVRTRWPGTPWFRGHAQRERIRFYKEGWARVGWWPCLCIGTDSGASHFAHIDSWSYNLNLQ